jgi:pyridinium-3,5-biscarboxylic acid mononucleotide sulfurtransferase
MNDTKISGAHGKYTQLQEILRTFTSVAVAFSGGIDSTFLLHAACETLGKGRVIALHGISCLLPIDTTQAASRIFERHFSGMADLRQIKLHPLRWSEFVVNNEERCYCCKKETYITFQTEMGKEGVLFLLDGTNVDDMKKKRPGLRAIRELKVETPLLKAGFNKQEIRDIARVIGLENYNLPSNSCLATRVPSDIPITTEILRLIDDAEHFLHEKGFYGCRVRPGVKQTVIEVSADDMERFTIQAQRPLIHHYFQTLGLSDVVINLRGRE